MNNFITMFKDFFKKNKVIFVLAAASISLDVFSIAKSVGVGIENYSALTIDPVISIILVVIFGVFYSIKIMSNTNIVKLIHNYLQDNNRKILETNAESLSLGLFSKRMFFNMLPIYVGALMFNYFMLDPVVMLITYSIQAVAFPLLLVSGTMASQYTYEFSSNVGDDILKSALKGSGGDNA